MICIFYIYKSHINDMSYRNLPAKEQLARMRRALAKSRGHVSRRHYSRLAPGRYVKGRGDFKSFFKTAASKLGNAAAGAIIGGLAGGPGGAALGAMSSLRQPSYFRIGGGGDYRSTNARRRYYRPMDSVPQFVNTRTEGAGSIRVSHREYIQDIVGSTGFNVQNFAIQPGVVATFPWLAGVAANWQQYRIHGMQFCYKATCATAVSSTNTALGTVIMATQYNAGAVAAGGQFANKQEMENYQGSVSTTPFQDLTHSLECAKSHTSINTLYVRPGVAVPFGQDPKTYDMGVFSIATVGMQAANTIGELWVTYDIELIKPAVPWGKGGSPVLTDHFVLTPANINYQQPWGVLSTSPALTPTPSSTINGQITYGSSTNNTYTFPSDIEEGQFLVAYQVQFNSGSGHVPAPFSGGVTLTLGSNLSLSTLFTNDTHATANIPFTGYTASSSQTSCGYMAIVYFNGGNTPGQSFLTSSPWDATTANVVTGGDLFITQISPQLDTSPLLPSRGSLDEFKAFMEWKRASESLPELEDHSDEKEERKYPSEAQQLEDLQKQIAELKSKQSRQSDWDIIKSTSEPPTPPQKKHSLKV